MTNTQHNSDSRKENPTPKWPPTYTEPSPEELLQIKKEGRRLAEGFVKALKQGVQKEQAE